MTLSLRKQKPRSPLQWWSPCCCSVCFLRSRLFVSLTHVPGPFLLVLDMEPCYAAWGFTHGNLQNHWPSNRILLLVLPAWFGYPTLGWRTRSQPDELTLPLVNRKVGSSQTCPKCLHQVLPPAHWVLTKPLHWSLTTCPQSSSIQSSRDTETYFGSYPNIV